MFTRTSHIVSDSDHVRATNTALTMNYPETLSIKNHKRNQIETLKIDTKFTFYIAVVKNCSFK